MPHVWLRRGHGVLTTYGFRYFPSIFCQWRCGCWRRTFLLCKSPHLGGQNADEQALRPTTTGVCPSTFEIVLSECLGTLFDFVVVQGKQVVVAVVSCKGVLFPYLDPFFLCRGEICACFPFPFDSSFSLFPEPSDFKEARNHVIPSPRPAPPRLCFRRLNPDAPAMLPLSHVLLRYCTCFYFGVCVGVFLCF